MREWGRDEESDGKKKMEGRGRGEGREADGGGREEGKHADGRRKEEGGRRMK